MRSDYYTIRRSIHGIRIKIIRTDDLITTFKSRMVRGDYNAKHGIERQSS